MRFDALNPIDSVLDDEDDDEKLRDTFVRAAPSNILFVFISSILFSLICKYGTLKFSFCPSMGLLLLSFLILILSLFLELSLRFCRRLLFVMRLASFSPVSLLLLTIHELIGGYHFFVMFGLVPSILSVSCK